MANSRPHTLWLLWHCFLRFPARSECLSHWLSFVTILVGQVIQPALLSVDFKKHSEFVRILRHFMICSSRSGPLPQRNMLGKNLPTLLGHDKGALDHVPQLPNIARPRVLLQN